MTYDIQTIYSRYTQLSKKERRQLLTSLQLQGINVIKIEAYEYKEAPGFKHLFFYFKNRKAAIPYFMLDKEIWQVIQKEIMKATTP
ncbi:hypothetical protein LPYR103PRE_23870 [Segatella asaccharophila]